ncbi:ankyrin repeat domain-containing protein [Flavobacterium sp. GT3R68]|uniref:ankyrin repeat domain-containing protein n=1 Tax=Flavobacterium sp. GT3R68 TaxID=2594437 RepID=UPI000F877E48|nr:ankyrin repeat domain-containing protein [Flavobacterium sp. GT3R68]RTY87272.1 ankyrin repeat domain-containing protein [Flavobacterium sp. GSN2]TRW89422.1 ankyrin repeat domain-containing protein [Flavobacterium sp. GT3R68]
MKYFYVTLMMIVLQPVFSQQDIFDVARKGTVEEIKNIIKQNPDAINSVNEGGYSPLVLACYKGNIAVADFLVTRVKDINGTSSMGTPLMAAVVKGNKEIVKILLDQKANPNIADPSGNTALIYATLFKHFEIVEMLLIAKADIALKDIRGNSAMDYAKMNNDEKLMQLLKN